MAPVLKLFASIAVGAGCLSGCVFRSFEERNRKDAREERTRNQTLAKAALIMKGVLDWSSAHGGNLPGPGQFASEVRPFVAGKAGPDVTAAEVSAAFDRFQWTFAGGKVSGEPSETEVGHLTEPEGEAIAYADGSVRRWRSIGPPR